MAVDETERALLVGRGMMALGAAMVALAIIGELVGWWNDFGPVLAIAGLVLGIMGLTVTVLMNATRSQVTAVAAGVAVGNSRLREVREDTRAIRAGMADANGKLDQANGKLDQANGKLDHTNARLDQATTTLDGIADLLRQIRDRL